MDSHRKGDYTEAVVIAELKAREVPVSTPFGDNERYDIVVETPDDRLLRVQVKTGWLNDGRVQVKTKSQHTNSRGNVYRRYDGDVDWFLAYCHENETLYWISEEETGTSMLLRVDEPDAYNSRINWAEEYEFDERWPPEDDDSATKADPQVVREAVDRLQSQGARVLRAVDEEDPRDITVETDHAVYRTRVEKGWLSDGRIRITPGSDADCYVVYCEETDAVYAVDDRDFEESISLRVDPVERDRSDINWASEYELARNWPPDPDGTPPRTLVEPAVTTAIDRLESKGHDVEFADWESDRRTLQVTTGGEQYRVRVETGYVTDGRLQFNANGGAVDHYLVYHEKADALYVVADDAFDASISLRVEPPERNDGTINWADDYAFDDRWPPR